MSRKSSGLRNKYRTGRSTYSRLGKSKVADHYGKFVNGKRQEDDRIGKHLRAVDSEFFFDEVTAAACDTITKAAQ